MEPKPEPLNHTITRLVMTSSGSSDRSNDPDMNSVNSDGGYGSRDNSQRDEVC